MPTRDRKTLIASPFPTGQRVVFFLLVLSGCFALPRDAQAFTVDEIKITEKDSGKSLENEPYYLNQARCQCKTQLTLTLELTGTSSETQFQNLQVRAGTSSCYNESEKTFDADCTVLIAATPITGIPTQYPVTIEASKLMGSSCSGQNATSRYILVYANTSADSSVWQKVTEKEFMIDTQSPRAPTNASVAAGEGMVTLSFTGSGSTSSTTTDAGVTTKEVDIKGYQVLCQKTDGTPGKDPAPEPGYEKAVNLCSGSCSTASTTTEDTQDAAVGYGGFAPYAADLGGLDGDSGPTDAGPADGQSRDQHTTADGTVRDSSTPTDSSATGKSGITCLEEAYVCSELSSPTASSIEIKGLENGTAYQFYVIAVDLYGNPSTATSAGKETPTLQEDLWERYKRSGGSAEGGHCFVATAAYGSYNHPQVRVLREFRDTILLPSSAGRWFVRSYYRVSPKPAAWLARHDRVRPLVRGLLWPVTLAAGSMLYTSGLEKVLVLFSCFLMISLVIYRRRLRYTR